MALELWWDEQDIAHIRHRSARYPGATDIEPSETREAAADPDRIVREPDPKSHRNCIRLIGYPPSAEAVLTVIAPKRLRWGHRLAQRRRLAHLPATIGKEATATTESDGTTPDVRETLDNEIAEQWAAADAADDPATRARQRESASIRTEIADEEAAAINAEIAENK